MIRFALIKFTITIRNMFTLLTIKFLNICLFFYLQGGIGFVYIYKS